MKREPYSIRTPFLTAPPIRETFPSAFKIAHSHPTLLLAWITLSCLIGQVLLIEILKTPFSFTEAAVLALLFALWAFLPAGALGSLEFELEHEEWRLMAFWQCGTFYFGRILFIHFIWLAVAALVYLPLLVFIILHLSFFTLILVSLLGGAVTLFLFLFSGSLVVVENSLPLNAISRSLRIISDNPGLSLAIIFFLLLPPLAGAYLLHQAGTLLPSPWNRLLSISGNVLASYFSLVSLSAVLYCNFFIRKVLSQKTY